MGIRGTLLIYDSEFSSTASSKKRESDSFKVFEVMIDGDFNKVHNE